MNPSHPNSAERFAAEDGCQTPLSGAHTSNESGLSDSFLPLAMPYELWHKLEAHRRVIFFDAQAVIDRLHEPQALGVAELCRQMQRTLDDLLPALRLLRALELIAVGPNASIQLVALPEDPLRVQGPDGRWRWMFISRPLREPAVDPARLC